MSIAGAIIPAAGYAVTTAATGYAIGFAIEHVSALSTSPRDFSPEGLLKTTAAVAVNGVFVMAASRLLGAQDDPTGGVLFSMALMGARPRLFAKFQKGSNEIEKRVRKAAGLKSIDIPGLAGELEETIF